MSRLLPVSFYRERSTDPLKLLALLLLFALAPWAWLFPIAFEAECLIAAGQWLRLAGYLAAAAGCLAGLCVVPFLGNGGMRIALTTVLLAGFAADRAVNEAIGEPMSFELLQTLWRERQMAGDALPFYQPQILRGLGIAALPALAFLLRPHPRRALGARFSLVPLAAMLAVGTVAAAANRIELFPAPFSVPSGFVVASLTLPEPVVRQPVEYDGPLQPELKKVVMVVDESVRGDVFGLNDPKYDNTPVLRAAGRTIINYGVAIASANCSAASRLILRVGMQQHELPDLEGKWQRLPAIWEYAHRAGYRTALIDAWTKPHSHMDELELQAIDDYRKVDSEPGYTREPQVARELLDLLAADEPTFIYVNKAGAHPAYNVWFPPDLDYDPSPLVRDLPLDDRRRAAVRDYHKALRWSVDGFFATILPAIRDREDTVLLYTSDHGQALFEGGYDGSHCSARPVRGEVLVPLFVVTGAPQWAARFEAEAQRAFGRADHLEVFPTLLELMGYPREWVEWRIGPGLLKVPLDRRRGFLVGDVRRPQSAWVYAD